MEIDYILSKETQYQLRRKLLDFENCNYKIHELKINKCDKNTTEHNLAKVTLHYTTDRRQEQRAIIDSYGNHSFIDLGTLPY